MLEHSITRPPTPQGDRIAAAFCLGVTGVVVAGLMLSVLGHEFRLLRTSTAGLPYPMPIYKLLPTPGSSTDPSILGVAGADFSQVYTAALALRHGQSPYRPSSQEYSDRFGRPPGYPPLTNWIYVPISYLPYFPALLLHSGLQLFGFLAGACFLLRNTRSVRHGWKVVAAVSSLYLLTPIGVSHLERGQFDFLPATALLLCVGCTVLPRGQVVSATVAALVGAMKWTAPVFLGCFAALGFLFSTGRRRWAFGCIPPIMALTIIAFWPAIMEYWNVTIQVFELDARPTGLTFQHVVPRVWSRALPGLLTVLCGTAVAISERTREGRWQLFRAASVPYALALASAAVGFGTISYEYHGITMLAMVPIVVIWTADNPDVSIRLKCLVCTSFGLFLIIAFRVFPAGRLFGATFASKLYFAFLLLSVVEIVCVCVQWGHRTRRRSGEM